MAIQWVCPGAILTRITRVAKTLGRDPACDTALAGRETSRRHAEVRFDGPVPVIRDLESRNGVYLNGNPVAAAPLQLGDVVRLGDWVGVVASFDPEIDSSFRDLVPGWCGGAKLAAVAEPVRRVAVTDLPVTVQGETGTGKEGIARAVHEWSQRTGPFVAVNCAALPSNLAEAELFGYRKGAFTGADRPALGYFRAAQDGTLLLDEILDLPLALQAKLLRVLEAHEVVPLGEARPVAINARVVAATQESLARAVSEGRFRPDLMARLDGLTVVLPPLRARREDILPLFQRLLRDKAGGRPPELEAKFVEQLLLYDWPLNVRELVLLARRLLALHGTEPTLRRMHLPDRMQVSGRVASEQEKPEKKPARAATEDEQAFDSLVEALRTQRGNVTRAAAVLGISRARAYRLLERRPEFEVAGLREEKGEG